MEFHSRMLVLVFFLSFYCESSIAQVFNLTLTVDEGLPAQTIVGDLRAGLPWTLDSSGFFISESRDSDVFRDFEIDGDTGIISTAVMLDRERADQYAFAAATLTGEVIQVTIRVNDVNDHAPEFSVEVVHLNVSESTLPGTCLLLEGAQDLDEGDHSTQGYRITNGDVRETFTVEIRPSGGSVLNLDLILLKALDRETSDSYNLTIEAFDGGVPPKTGQLQVIVTVLDENDHQPVFNQSAYHGVVTESASLLTPVCQVFATDRDIGSNGLVTYVINRRRSDPNEFFTIDSSTGIIRVNKALDYEKQSFFELIVTAWDSGTNPESSSTFVGIKILNVNDNHPNISILFLNEAGEPNVSEGASLGYFVARIAVSDPDLGEAEAINVTLQGGDGKFSLNSTDDFLYVLYVDGLLDREEKDRFELTVTAKDFGPPSLSSESKFQVYVTDVNDNPPVFEQNIYEGSVPEDAHAGTSLLHIKATDRDQEGDSGITYSIVQPDLKNLLLIDPESGLITTDANLDHEREADLWFLVVAADSGSPPLSSTCTVIIHVTDINDNKPVFQQTFYNVTIQEHTAVGTCILQVTAIDSDDGVFGDVRYSFPDYNSSNDEPFFHINPVTGETCVSRDIDHEAGLVTFDLLLKAEDQDGFNSQTFLHIDVEDVNDNTPVFSPEKYSASVTLHAQPGTELLSVYASDRDSGNNGKITYKLLPGDSASLFTLDHITGAVFLNSSLSQLHSNSLKLLVSAQDGGGASAITPADITINILESVQPISLFQKSHYTFFISEDAPIGSSVGSVQATNPANSVEDVLYVISSGDLHGLFSVDAQSGLIVTNQILDHESLSCVLLTVQFYTGLFPIYSSAQVNITITDVNDNAPVFRKSSEHITISHYIPPGMSLYIAQATDNDSELNGKIRYIIRPESQLFAIEPSLGILSLNSEFSMDVSQKYELNIVAEDDGVPHLSSALKLVIVVDYSQPMEDLLVFETLVYQVEIGENARKDARLIQVRAHRAQDYFGDPQAIAYSLKALSGFPPFSIHTESGWMFVSQSLDYETEPEYKFFVCAKLQNGNSDVTATATVVVSVQDENDNAPAFSREMYFFRLQEAPSPHGLVGSVQATDKDSLHNGLLFYILLSDGQYFRIDSRTGEITNTVALDRESQGQHVLRVMATDHGRPRLNSTATIHILVTDVNDNPPKFTHVPATKKLNVQVWPGIPEDSVIISMFAKDPDAGENGTVTFSMKDDELGHFSIDSRSGEIKVTPRFSSSPQVRYLLTVVATDNGLISLDETVELHIQVYALGQHQGTSMDFQDIRHFTVEENVKVGTAIGSVSISQTPMRYSISEGDGGSQFGIYSVTGELYVAQHLDFEVRGRYFLVVRAEAPPSINVTMFVVVSVVDVNEHAPWFPTIDGFVQFAVDEDVFTGTSVYVFNARDADGSLQHSEVLYSLTYDINPVAAPPPFLIDPHTGILMTNAHLDREGTEEIVFRVTASDITEESGARKQSSVVVKVILMDANDNSPMFVSPKMASLPEDAEMGMLVHLVMATDEDEGSNALVTYTVTSGNENGCFHMDQTGHLYLNSTLDYESNHVHILTIQARDGGEPSLSSTQTLTVQVLDVNDQPPVFKQHIYNASIMENRQPGEDFAKVTAVDLDSGENAAVTYVLLPGPGYDLFTIDSHSGQIQTRTVLDREKHSSFTLRVQAKDSGTPSLSSTATVLCSILDDNDNPPQFSHTDLYIAVLENLPVGIIHIVQAFDADHGLNGTILYSLKEGEGCFSIDPVTGAISTSKVLDREERSNYSLLITASDYGHPPLISVTTLNITVSDENDNNPAFTRKSYRATISEGLSAGSEVMHLTAKDPDEGSNGVIVFSLEEENSGHFYVDASTGVIHLTKPLDRETRSQHVFRAVATDGCSQGPRSSIATVTILVEDVNDNPPSCNWENVSVPVNSGTARPHHPILTLVAHDPDQGENGTVIFSLAEDDELFQVERSSGAVMLKVPVKKDFSGTKMLQVLAADLGRPSLTSSCLLLLQLNRQELPLRFTEELYEVTMLENSSTGTWVANIVARDLEADEETITYRIFSGNEKEIFTIHPSTGDITVRQQNLLDFETERKTLLVVLAGNGEQTAHARVSIVLQDVNDNPPTFKQSYYRTAVWEGQMHNTYVMQVQATDADSGVNGQISYFIVDGNHNNAFAIDSIRGILATNAVLDREIVSSYKLTLLARDMGSPSLSSTCTVRVQVVDVNDNSPMIPSMEPVTIAENLPAGYFVTQVVANDVDLSPLAIYRLMEKNESSSFTVDRYSGVISTTESLDFEKKAIYSLRVEASDYVHQTVAELIVKVSDVNDSPPVFTQETYQVALSEHTAADTFVVAVSASDEDSGQNGRISYRLLSSPVRGFYIDPKNGSIFTNKPLNGVANRNVLQLLVEARDNGEPSLLSVTSVLIEVVDVNDNPPVFTQNSYHLSVSEAATVGSVLLTLSAEDKDFSGENVALEYAIVGGNDERRFCMDAVEVSSAGHPNRVGLVILCDVLDRERTDRYSLVVMVADRGNPPLNSTTVVSVKVVDVNDNSPEFNRTEYYSQVRENSAIGTSLITIFAQDPDLGVNGEVMYSIVSGDSRGLFGLDSATGLLEINGTLDYEKDTKFTITICASDCGTVRKVSFAVVHILVLDENDNSPFFVSPTINCTVSENLPAYSPVCISQAIDEDAGSFGLLTYSIVSSCFMDYESSNPERKEAFSVDPLTGDIHTKQTFDYERENKFCLVVEARDKGDQVSTLRVQIDIEGVDEFSPVFSQNVYHFSLPTNARVGESIGQLMAMDNDGGLDGLVEYALVSPSPFFSVNKSTGRVFISNSVYQRRSISNETIEELVVQASSPKLDSRFSTCRALVNTSNSAQTLTSVALSARATGLSVLLIVFLLILISIIALVLRYKSKETCMKTASFSGYFTHESVALQQTDGNLHGGMMEASSDVWAKINMMNPIRNSKASSGRGSSEDETAEDQEINMINKLAVALDHTSRVSDSGLPGDSDHISFHSIEEYPPSIGSFGIVQILDMASSESLHNFKDEGGGEGLLPQVVNMKEVEEVMRRCMSIGGDQGPVKGSLTNLVSAEEQLHGSYGWDYFLNWQPRFQSLASVFTDIGTLPDEGTRTRDVEPESQSLLHPPPLITAVAQPGIRSVPPRMPHRTQALVRSPACSKSCTRVAGLSPSAMTPSFSPSLSLLTVRTPNASPVVSEAGMGCYTKLAALSRNVMDEDGEIQV